MVNGHAIRTRDSDTHLHSCPAAEHGLLVYAKGEVLLVALPVLIREKDVGAHAARLQDPGGEGDVAGVTRVAAALGGWGEWGGGLGGRDGEERDGEGRGGREEGEEEGEEGR